MTTHDNHFDTSHHPTPTDETPLTSHTNCSCFSQKHARPECLKARSRQWEGWQQSEIALKKRHTHEAAKVAKAWSQLREGWAAAVCPHVQLPFRSRLVTLLLSQDLLPLTLGPKCTVVYIYTKLGSLFFYWCVCSMCLFTICKWLHYCINYTDKDADVNC